MEYKKRLNLSLSMDLYNKMIARIEQTDVKNPTHFIRIAIMALLTDEIVKDGSIKYKDLPDIFKILSKLYNISKFKNPKAKLELYYLYHDIKKVLPMVEKCPYKEYHVNRLDISMKELIVFELSCQELNILIDNSIIKEGVSKCQIQE